jgi:hypothetical protein
VEHALVRRRPDGRTDAVLYVQESEETSEQDLTTWVHDRLRAVLEGG